MLTVSGIHRFVGHIGSAPIRKTVLLLFMFFAGIHFEAFRFDDYHALVAAIVLWICSLALGLSKVPGGLPRGLLLRLGLLTGLVMVCRLNDGCMLALACLAIIVLEARQNRVKRCLYFIGGIGVVVLLTHLAVRDTWTAWWHHAVAGGASAKGGVRHLVKGVLLLPVRAAQSLVTSRFTTLIYQILATLTVVTLLARLAKRHLAWRVLFILACWFSVGVLPFLIREDPFIPLSAFGVVIATLAVMVLLALGGCHLLHPIVRPEVFMLLIPIGLWVSGAMSSGGWFYGLYFPFALFLLMSAIVGLPFFIASLEALLYGMLAILAACGLHYRYEIPCAWHAYRAAPLFQERVVIQHPVHGYMYLERSLMSHQDFLWQRINGDLVDDLLSIPWPFANYYLNRPPWKNHIQTFFDTSSAENVQALVKDLELAPPSWILFHHQPGNLVRHEATFNDGHPLPHRLLEAFILNQIRNDLWSIDWSSTDDRLGQWLLIRTSGRGSRVSGTSPALSSNRQSP